MARIDIGNKTLILHKIRNLVTFDALETLTSLTEL